MKTESGLYYGIVPGEVGMFLSKFFEQLPSFAFAMIISIDSTREVHDLAAMLRRCGIDVRINGPVVLVAPEMLRRAADCGMFVSFDEVWLLTSDCLEREVPTSRLLGCDAESVRSTISATERGMRDAQCVLALSGGVDVGYATWDADFAELIEKGCPGNP